MAGTANATLSGRHFGSVAIATTDIVKMVAGEAAGAEAVAVNKQM